MLEPIHQREGIVAESGRVAFRWILCMFQQYVEARPSSMDLVTKYQHHGHIFSHGRMDFTLIWIRVKHDSSENFLVLSMSQPYFSQWDEVFDENPTCLLANPAALALCMQANAASGTFLHLVELASILGSVRGSQAQQKQGSVLLLSSVSVPVSAFPQHRGPE